MFETAVSGLELAMSIITATRSAPPISSDDVACGTSLPTASSSVALASLREAGDCATTAGDSHEDEIWEEQQTSLPGPAMYVRSEGQILGSCWGGPDKETEEKNEFQPLENAKAAFTKAHVARAGHTCQFNFRLLQEVHLSRTRHRLKSCMVFADVGASMLPAWAEALRTSLAGPLPASSSGLQEKDSSGAATQGLSSQVMFLCSLLG